MSALRVDKVLLSGSFWTTIGEIIAGVAGLAGSILAARVLSPRDFGLMGTTMLTLSVLEHFSQTGFDTALVQRSSNVEGYLDVAWTWHVLRGVLITLILCALSPLLSRFYDEPTLFPLIIACSLSVALAGAGNVGQIFFTRKLDFKTLFLIKTAHSLLRLGIFIPAILIFRNVWALVAGHLGGAVLGLAISYLTHPYRPKLKWDFPKLRELIAYGKWLSGLAIIGFIITKGDDVFVSKYLGLTALGAYQLAYDISNMPATNITHVIGRIGFPTYARLSGDKEELQKAFIKIMRITLLISGPVSALIYIAVPDIVAHVIGAKWSNTIPLIRILVLSGYVRSFAALAGPIFQATGRPDFDFKMNLPRFFCTVLLIWPFCAYFGLEGACWVVLIAIVTTLPTWFYGIKLLSGVRPGDVLRHNALPLLATLLFSAAYYGVRSQLGTDVPSAVLGLVGGLALWLIALYGLGKVTPLKFFDEIDKLRALAKGS